MRARHASPLHLPGADDRDPVSRRREAAASSGDPCGSGDRAEAEEAEAREIERYLPAELSDEDLGGLVDAAIAESGASEPGEMGKVMGALMPKVGGRADGKRVSATVRERLASK